MALQSTFLPSSQAMYTMQSDNTSDPQTQELAASWQPLSSRQRRVLGVLIEKGKTTPDAYPLSLNGLTTGCNQKSNRSPQMNITSLEVEEVLEQLRLMGAVAEVHGGGRVPKYRHYAYEWLGVDKVEIAVIAELMLRGEQTVGELRGRASRIEPIADVASLRPVIDSLIAKNLVIALSPVGRGQMVTHNLYKPRELDELRTRLGAAPAVPQQHQPAAAAASTNPVPASAGVGQGPSEASAAVTAVPSAPAVTRDMYNELQLEVNQLHAEVARLRTIVEELASR